MSKENRNRFLRFIRMYENNLSYFGNHGKNAGGEKIIPRTTHARDVSQFEHGMRTPKIIWRCKNFFNPHGDFVEV